MFTAHAVWFKCGMYVNSSIGSFGCDTGWPNYSSVFIPYQIVTISLSLVIPIHVLKVFGKVAQSGICDSQVGLVLCSPIVHFLVHVLTFTMSWHMFVLTIHEHVLVKHQNWRRNLLVQVKLTHDPIWIVIINHPEVNHPHTT
jgi:hypothetical protein